MPLKNLITQQGITSAKLERAKELRHEMTTAERYLWERLRTGRLKEIHFRRQQVIEPYIVDFYCHQAGLVVEVDGDVHREQEEYDRKRNQDLQERGLLVLRFSNNEVLQNIAGVVAKILDACGKAMSNNQNSKEEE